MLTVDFSTIPLKPGMRVLDAGCGSGRHLCEAFRTPGVDVAGCGSELGRSVQGEGVSSP